MCLRLGGQGRPFWGSSIWTGTWWWWEAGQVKTGGVGMFQTKGTKCEALRGASWLCARNRRLVRLEPESGQVGPRMAWWVGMEVPLWGVPCPLMGARGFRLWVCLSWLVKHGADILPAKVDFDSSHISFLPFPSLTSHFPNSTKPSLSVSLDHDLVPHSSLIFRQVPILGLASSCELVPWLSVTCFLWSLHCCILAVYLQHTLPCQPHLSKPPFCLMPPHGSLLSGEYQIKSLSSHSLFLTQFSSHNFYFTFLQLNWTIPNSIMMLWNLLLLLFCVIIIIIICSSLGWQVLLSKPTSCWRTAHLICHLLRDAFLDPQTWQNICLSTLEALCLCLSHGAYLQNFW